MTTDVGSGDEGDDELDELCMSGLEGRRLAARLSEVLS